MIYILIGIIVIVLDQVTKYLVRGMGDGEVIHVIGDFLRIVHVENSGAAFGMLAGSRRFLLIFPALIVAGAIYFLSRDLGSDLKGKLTKTALALIASGGIGNMIDRFLYGHVTDMISFSIVPPVFNVADIAVTCGCGLLVFCLIYFNNDEKQEAAASADDRGEARTQEDRAEAAVQDEKTEAAKQDGDPEADERDNNSEAAVQYGDSEAAAQDEKTEAAKQDGDPEADESEGR